MDGFFDCATGALAKDLVGFEVRDADFDTGGAELLIARNYVVSTLVLGLLVTLGLSPKVIFKKGLLGADAYLGRVRDF